MNAHYIYGDRRVPISFEQASALLRSRTADRRYCLMVFYVRSWSRAARIFERIRRQLEPEDLSAVRVAWRGHQFTVAAARREHLPPEMLAEVAGRRVTIWAPCRVMAAATELILDLLTEPADALALAA